MARYARMMHGAAAAVAAGRPVKLVRFERLVDAPAEAMTGAARACGLDYDPAMVDPANSYAQHEKTRFVWPYSGADRRVRPRSLDTTAVTEWRGLLLADEADAVVATLPADLTWTLCDRGEDLPCTT
jgi:hypothetical protein